MICITSRFEPSSLRGARYTHHHRCSYNHSLMTHPSTGLAIHTPINHGRLPINQVPDAWRHMAAVASCDEREALRLLAEEVGCSPGHLRLYDYTTLLLYYSTTILLYYSTTVLLYYCITALLYYCTILIYYTTILYYYYTIQL